MKLIVPDELLWVGDEPLVKMVEIDEVDCHLPFWDQTLARNSRAVQLLSLDKVIDDHSVDRILKGFIYHINRCGSTLVSNAFKTIGRCRVLSEPFVFQQLLDTNRGSAAKRNSWLRKLMLLHTRALCTQDEVLIIKWPSLLALHVNEIESAFQNMPAIFLYRDPVEVLVSIKRDALGGAEFIRPEHLGENAESCINGEAQASKLRINALYIAHICHKISVAKNIMAVNYAELPEAIIERIVHFFNISLSALDRGAIIEAANIYSKDSKATLTFISDSLSKLTEATPEILALAEEIILPVLHKTLALIDKPAATQLH